MQVLIVKTSALGDVIHAFPVVAYLRRRFPDCKIDWIVEEQSADLVRAHPDIRKAIPVKTKAWRKSPFSSQTWQEIRNYRKVLKAETYDCVIDLQGNIKSGLLAFPAKCRNKIGFGFKTVPEWPNVLFTNSRFNPPKGHNIREDYLNIVQSYFQDSAPIESSSVTLKTTPEQLANIERLITSPELKNKPKVMICPGSAWKNKQMTSEGLLGLMQRLHTKMKCAFVLVWGSQEEREIVQQLHQLFPSDSIVSDRMPLPALQNLMGRVDLVVAMDSLPLHLAGTTSTKIFGVFGASAASKYQPIGAGCSSMQGSCPYGRTFEKRCPILRTCSTGLCIRGLTGSDVFKKFEESH